MKPIVTWNEHIEVGAELTDIRHRLMAVATKVRAAPSVETLFQITIGEEKEGAE